MGLREIANLDNRRILNDRNTGFGWPISITNPAGTTESFTGFGNDIAALIDPETGQSFSGRLASIAVNTLDLYNKGFVLPRNINKETEKPWLVEFDDIDGNTYKFKVQASNPDRGLGMIILLLETYKDGA